MKQTQIVDSFDFNNILSEIQEDNSNDLDIKNCEILEKKNNNNNNYNNTIIFPKTAKNHTNIQNFQHRLIDSKPTVSDRSKI